jgi:STE24 endopeptidase
MAQVLANPNTTLLSAPDPERQKMAYRYARSMVTVSLWQWPMALIFFLILQIPSATITLRNWSRSISNDPGVVVALYVLAVAGFILLVSLPISYIAGYALPRKYGLMPMSALQWWIEHAKTSARNLFLWVGVAEFFYWLARASGNGVWPIVAVLWWGASVLAQYFWPLDRLGIEKLIRLDDPKLNNRLSRLAERAHLPALSMWIVPRGKKTRTSNAWFLGMGKARKIVLTDTLIESLNYDELEAILAHELAHAAHGHIRKALAFRWATVLVTSFIAYYMIAYFGSSNGLRGVADVATLTYPLMAYVLGSSLLSTIKGSRSRKAEQDADRYAMELTGNPDAFKSAMIKLADLNLIETHPSGRMGKPQQTHPTIGERMLMADIAAGRPVLPLPQEEGWKRPAKRVIRDGAGGSYAQDRRYSAALNRYTPFVVRRIRI